MREAGFPIERDPAEAWPDFVGWRVNYEQAAYAVAAAVYAVPPLWSGPRRQRSRRSNPEDPGSGHGTTEYSFRRGSFDRLSDLDWCT
jgi:hypothetical protein